MVRGSSNRASLVTAANLEPSLREAFRSMGVDLAKLNLKANYFEPGTHFQPRFRQLQHQPEHALEVPETKPLVLKPDPEPVRIPLRNGKDVSSVMDQLPGISWSLEENGGGEGGSKRSRRQAATTADLKLCADILMDQEEDNLDTFYAPLEEDNGYDDVRILSLTQRV